jgi:hypothetical protein
VSGRRSNAWRGALVLCLACGQRPAPAPTFVSLGGDAAHVGQSAISRSLVAQVARAGGLSPREALDGLIEDALLAQAAKAGGLDGECSVRQATVATAARLLSARLNEDARVRGAPTDDELAKIRVVHALVLRSPTLAHARALDIARAILRAVSDARSDEDFETQAKQVPHVGAQVVIERLGAFDASGNLAEGGALDADFTSAAFRLHTRGETSGIVKTPFGWHVIRLMERLSPEGASLERLREELAGTVQEMRVRTQLGIVLDDHRQRVPVEISADADALMVQAASAP